MRADSDVIPPDSQVELVCSCRPPIQSNMAPKPSAFKAQQMNVERRRRYEFVFVLTHIHPFGHPLTRSSGRRYYCRFGDVQRIPRNLCVSRVPSTHCLLSVLYCLLHAQWYGNKNRPIFSQQNQLFASVLLCNYYIKNLYFLSVLLNYTFFYF